jgi:putative DNA primase/helicase
MNNYIEGSSNSESGVGSSTIEKNHDSSCVATDSGIEVASIGCDSPIGDSFTTVPAELKALARWVVRDAHKVPHDPRTGRGAKPNDSSTWCDYEQAVANCDGYAGIGCMIAPPFVGIDLDKCRNAESGEVEPWATEIITGLHSYTELSPSETGFHIWVRGELAEGRRRAGRFEMYGETRYFTVTGLHVPGTPLTIERANVQSLQSRIESIDPLNKRTPVSKQPDQVAINGTGSKYDALMAGNWQGMGIYPSQSDADEALCVILALKHQSDAEVIDAKFRESKLMRPKWDEKRGAQTYGRITIRTATDFVAKLARTSELTFRKRDEPVDWRAAFKSYSQMEKGEIQFLVKNLFPYGVTFVGGLSAAGKTWFVLSLVKSLVTGEKFLGKFEVPESMPVIYLVPESGERAFRARLDTMRLSEAGEQLLCRTMDSGKILGLQSPELIEACGILQPVVILDTAIRFSAAQDENSASQNKELTDGIFGLRTAGAKAVVAIHHCPKTTSGKEMTLQNSLRGTGDYGAISDAVYALECADQETLEIRVQCVKARDFEPPKPFTIRGRPYLNTTGDFASMTESGWGAYRGEVEKLVDAIVADPTIDYRGLTARTGISSGRIRELAAKAGWAKDKKAPWTRSVAPSLFAVN